MSFYKGEQVRVVETNREVFGRRALTEEEREAWRQSPEAQGLDSAGETKLAPRSTCVTLKGHTLTVVRGRARMTCVWGDPVPGYTLVVREDGVECFVSTNALRAV